MFLKLSMIISTVFLLPTEAIGCGIFDHNNVDRCPPQMGRIIGGYSAWRWPWPVQLLVGFKRKRKDAITGQEILEECDSSRQREGTCGATIIDESNLVTAAHCFDDWDAVCYVKFKLGMYNYLTKDIEWDVTTIDKNSGQIIKHDEYEGDYNDIAIIKLKEPMAFGQPGDPAENLGPVCLPENTNGINTTDCFVVGWGRTDPCYNEKPGHLKQAAIPILDDDECRRTLKPHNKTYKPDVQLCAGHLESGAPDTCTGDSGGPLVCRINNMGQGKEGLRWFLMGVTSFGSDPCAMKNYPGVYTRVSRFVGWIERNKMKVKSHTTEKPRVTKSRMQAEKDEREEVSRRPIRLSPTKTKIKTSTIDDEKWEPRRDPKPRKPKKKLTSSQSGTSIVFNNDNYND